MKRHGQIDQLPAGGGASSATLEDLALATKALAEAERQRARAAVALARVRARGDGEAAVGMSVEQHLRHTSRVGRRTVDEFGLLTDVLGEMVRVRRQLEAGAITVAQAVAIARPAAHVGLHVREALDGVLAADLSVDGSGDWTSWEPEQLEADVRRTIALLTPSMTVERERATVKDEWLHVQPTLDGQAMVFKGRYEGLNAALFDSVLDAASMRPRAGVRRATQAAAGLARVLRDWATGGHRLSPADTDAPAAPVTIHLLVDERTAGEGAAAEVWTSTPGLAPTLTAATVASLRHHATVVTVFTRDGNPVSIAGRGGHAEDDPDGLSEDSQHELVRCRDGNRCRMPGCDRPLRDVHHLVHRIDQGSDRLSNLAGLCARCHHRVLHRHGWGGQVDVDGRLHLRRGRDRLTSPARKHLRLRRPPPVPLDLASLGPIHHSPGGTPLPF